MRRFFVMLVFMVGTLLCGVLLSMMLGKRLAKETVDNEFLEDYKNYDGC